MHWLKTVYFTVMALAFLASLRGYKQREYVLFIPLLALSFSVEMLRHLYPKLESTLRFFVAVEYAFLALIISNFIHSRKKRLVIQSSIFVIVPVLIFIQWKIVNRSPAYQYLDVMIESPFVCVWTILYLFETIKQEQEFEVTKNPMFWISLGNLLFFSGSFFSYGFGSYLAFKGSAMAQTIYGIARVLNILLYILYFIGFLCLKKKR